MSRCYPYQPTGSVWNGASGQPLIGTIKLHCDSKTELLIEKKKERKERKEKRKERKEKEKLYGFCDRKVKKLHNEKCYRDEKNRGLLGYLLKRSEDEGAEGLDKSDLTDEHDEPVCYLSDGTQSGNKRKRQPSPCIITPSAVPSTKSSITVRDNIIRIRLSSQKHSKTDASLSNGQSCSTSGRATNSNTQPKEMLQVQDQKYCGIANKNGSPIPDSVREESILLIGGKPTANGNTLYEIKEQRTKLFYESLIEDWVPPPFRSVPDEVDNEEWLFGTEQQMQGLKRLKAGNDFLGVVSCQQNSTMWPCAHRLAEADIDALPYTIPY